MYGFLLSPLLRRTESTEKDMELKVNVIGSTTQGLYAISHRRDTRLKGVVECLLYSDNAIYRVVTKRLQSLRCRTGKLGPIGPSLLKLRLGGGR